MYGTSIYWVRGIKPVQVIRWFTVEGGVDVIPKFLVIITIYSDLSMFKITSVEDVNWMSYQNFKDEYENYITSVIFIKSLASFVLLCCLFWHVDHVCEISLQIPECCGWN